MGVSNARHGLGNTSEGRLEMIVAEPGHRQTVAMAVHREQLLSLSRL